MTGRPRPSAVGLMAAALGAIFLLLPAAGLVWRAPWSELGTILVRGQVRDALRLSVVTSVAATALALILGLPLAWVLGRLSFPGRRLLRALTVLPMVLPPVVGGVALLLALGRRGVVGQHLDSWLGVTLPFSTAGVVVAETFVAMPFLVVTVEAGLRSADRRYEEAARSLGAHRGTVLRRVTLPAVWPSLVAGTVLCWARALGEFGATITFAGNLPGRTATIPLAVFGELQASDPGSAIVLSLVLLAVSVAVLVGLRERWLGAG